MHINLGSRDSGKQTKNSYTEKCLLHLSSTLKWQAFCELVKSSDDRVGGRRKKKKIVSRFTHCTQIYFLSFRSLAILLSGKFWTRRGQEECCTFYSNLSDFFMNKLTFLDIDKFFSSFDILYKNLSDILLI